MDYKDRLNLKESLHWLNSEEIYQGMAAYLMTWIQPVVERIEDAKGHTYLIGRLMVLAYEKRDGVDVPVPPREVPFAFEVGELYGLDYMGDGVWVNDEQRAKTLNIAVSSQPMQYRLRMAREVASAMMTRLLMMMMVRYKGSIDMALGEFGKWLGNNSGKVEMPKPNVTPL